MDGSTVTTAEPCEIQRRVAFKCVLANLADPFAFFIEDPHVDEVTPLARKPTWIDPLRQHQRVQMYVATLRQFAGYERCDGRTVFLQCFP